MFKKYFYYVMAETKVGTNYNIHHNTSLDYISSVFIQTCYVRFCKKKSVVKQEMTRRRQLTVTSHNREILFGETEPIYIELLMIPGQKV